MSNADLDWLVALLIAVILAALCAFWALNVGDVGYRGRPHYHRLEFNPPRKREEMAPPRRFSPRISFR
jgi:hypothetical protein